MVRDRALDIFGSKTTSLTPRNTAASTHQPAGTVLLATHAAGAVLDLQCAHAGRNRFLAG